jgi:AraC family L-rhamnose operon transcriptional activator RhaR
LTSRPENLSWRQTFPTATAPLALGRGAGHTLHGDGFAHDHDFMEIALIVRGRGMHVSGEGEVPLARGDVLLLRPGVWHAYRQCEELVVRNCCFTVSLVQRELRSLLDDRTFALLSRGSPLQIYKLEDGVVERMAWLLETYDPATLMDAAGILLLVLRELSRSAGLGKAEIHPCVVAAVEALQNDPAAPWTLASLADTVALNGSYLSRLFHAQIGLPPLGYLSLLRGEMAASLLLRTDLSCGQIAERVGWSDPNLFSRRFRARYGVSPTAYRSRRASAG